MIRIEDLREPVHSEAARAAIEMVEGIPFELTREAVIDAARAECDVPLYEEEDLFARLQEYIEAVDADTEDPDNDGLVNDEEAALGTNPNPETAHFL